MICKRCGNDRKLVKAHAIPEAFFRVLREGGETPIVVTNTPGKYKKRAPIGVYDTEILCEECEVGFGPLDTYGSEVLLQSLDEAFSPVLSKDEPLVFAANDIDQDRLKRFVLSVLWRAGVSRQDFYSGVDLGPHQDPLMELVERNSPSPVDEFTVVLSRWIYSPDREEIASGLMSPFRERWGGVNAVRLYMGKVLAYIKVDRRPFPDHLREPALGRFDQTYMVARELEGSKDLDAMCKVVQASARAA